MKNKHGGTRAGAGRPLSGKVSSLFRHYPKDKTIIKEFIKKLEDERQAKDNL